MDDANVRIFRCEPVRNLARPIPASIVHDDHFVLVCEGTEHGQRGSDGTFDVALFVVHRKEQREGVLRWLRVCQRPLMLRNLCTRLPWTSAV